MGVLEQVQQLKGQGIADAEITSSLQQQGFAPNEISNALSQSQVKDAVSSENQGFDQSPPVVEQEYAPQTQEVGQEQYYPQEGGNDQQYYYPQGGGAQGGGYGSSDTDRLIEISGQVFTEKISKIQKKVDESYESKEITKTKLDNIDARLKKVENVMDKLQIAIIEKVGSYGNMLSGIKKEMTMMQDSFGKVVNSTVKKNSKKK